MVALPYTMSFRFFGGKWGHFCIRPSETQRLLAERLTAWLSEVAFFCLDAYPYT